MTDAELDALQAKLARQVTIKMCQQAADAIAALREQVAAKDAEIVDTEGRWANKIVIYSERAERAEADNAALRERAEKYEAIAVAQTEACRKAEADNAALRKDAERYRWLKLHGLHLWQMESGMNDAAIDDALLAGKADALEGKK